jgi:hypothetical protein
MTKIEQVFNHIDIWVSEGLITPDLGEQIKQWERVHQVDTSRKVGVNEIFLYLGSLAIFLAIAFLIIYNWEAIGSVGRVLSVILPALVMWGLGWGLRNSESPRLKRGAQALWLSASLLTGTAFLVIFNEMGAIDFQDRGPTDPYFLLSCLLAMIASGVAYTLLPTITQSIIFHLWGALSLASFIGVLEYVLPEINPFTISLIYLGCGAVAGVAWITLGEWLISKGRSDLTGVSRVFGSLTILGFAFQISTLDYNATWQKTFFEAITFLVCIAFIAAGVKRQSLVYLFSGAAFLLFWITYINFEHFAEQLGLPVALLVTGVILIALGLGTERLSKQIRTPK